MHRHQTQHRYELGPTVQIVARGRRRGVPGISPPRETDARLIPFDEGTLQAIGELITLSKRALESVSAPMPKGRRSDTWPRWPAVTCSRDSISQTLPAPRSLPYRGTKVDPTASFRHNDGMYARGASTERRLITALPAATGSPQTNQLR